jgi:hypothetical protein
MGGIRATLPLGRPPGISASVLDDKAVSLDRISFPASYSFASSATRRLHDSYCHQIDTDRYTKTAGLTISGNPCKTWFSLRFLGARQEETICAHQNRPTLRTTICPRAKEKRYHPCRRRAVCGVIILEASTPASLKFRREPAVGAAEEPGPIPVNAPPSGVFDKRIAELVRGPPRRGLGFGRCRAPAMTWCRA